MGLLATSAAASPLRRKSTPPMVAGPFYPEPKDKPLETDTNLARLSDKDVPAAGTRINLSGRIIDLDGDPVGSALVEIWQADTRGRYHHPADPNPTPLDPNFQGYGAMVTGSDGKFSFQTVKPGAYPMDANNTRAPHIHLQAAAPTHPAIATQLFFAGESMNDQDAILHSLPPVDQERLIIDFAPVPTNASDQNVFAGEFDMVLAPA
eukprot:s1_g2600.t1